MSNLAEMISKARDIFNRNNQQKDVTIIFPSGNMFLLTREHDTWIICPHCKKKLIRITEESEVKKIFTWCKGCKREVEVNIWL